MLTSHHGDSKNRSEIGPHVLTPWIVILAPNTFLLGLVDSTLVMCTCIGVGFLSTTTSGVVLTEQLYQGSELSQFCQHLNKTAV